MPLPDLIEIVPLARPVRAEITVPGSKSITNRALILAALAEGDVTLTGALWSEDTQVMVEALKVLGFEVKVELDAAEFCNRTISVGGRGGRIPNAGTPAKPLELFVGNAGTAARFLAALVCLGSGTYRLSGVPRMHERPQAALFQALRELGYRVDSTSDKLPATFFGSSRGDEAHSEKEMRSLLTSAATSEGLRSCTVSIEESSQFASALLLSAKHGGWNVKVAGDDAEEAPYVAMTERLLEAFPWSGGRFQIEPDASSGSYFWAADCLAPHGSFDNPILPAPTLRERFSLERIAASYSEKLEHHAINISEISVADWPKSRWQIDSQFFPLFLYVWKSSTVSRRSDLGDSIMTAVIIAPFYEGAMKFTDLGRLRLQECERVVALRSELTKCGAKVVEEGDTLTVYPSQLHGAEIETYNDHRMAMCFAILGLKVPGIKLKNPACVKKTFPNFFQKLATPPPNGLGAEIRDGHTGRKLEMEELFAD